MNSFYFDTVAIAISCLILLSYYLFLIRQARTNPDFTVHSVNQKVRYLWVLSIMQNPGKDVMAVQTLRNWLMGATFKASSAILLIIGTLTLSGQAENLAKTWHVLNIGGSQEASWWTVKIMCLLSVLIVAFFAFAITIRLLNHAVFMINLPAADMQGALSLESIVQRLNHAGAFYTVGMRAFFITVPLAFWLFGSIFLIASTIGLIVILYYLDRSPW